MLKLSDIRVEWQRVKPGLEQLVAKTGAPFMPEDIFALCAASRASLFLDPDTGVFCVLQRREEAIGGRPYLYIYAAWVPHGISVESYWPEIQKIAVNIEAEFVEMVSSRKGFERRPEWEFEYSCYRRRV